MQDQITLLRKLQDFDLKIDAIHDRTRVKREALDELVSLYESLMESLEAQRAQLEETRTMMRDKEIELEANEERYNQSKAKLNSVSNTREYNALEREMDAQRKIRAQLEEERESLSDALEGHTAEVTERARKTEELAAQIKSEEAALADEASKAGGDVEDLVKTRDGLKEKLPKPLFRRYEFIAGRRNGPAVVAAREGVCTGCHMRMPPQLFNELQVGRKIIQCPSCQRILFFDPIANDEATA